MSEEKKQRPQYPAGWHKDLTNEQYHGSSGYSSSQIKTLAKQTPAHLKQKMSEPHKQTEAMLLGSIVHKIVLEPDDFADEFIIMPEGLERPTLDNFASFARGKARKDTVNKIMAWQEFNSACEGYELISQAMYDKARWIRDGVHRKPEAVDMLEDILPEQSMYYWYEALDPGRS